MTYFQTVGQSDFKLICCCCRANESDRCFVFKQTTRATVVLVLDFQKRRKHLSSHARLKDGLFRSSARAAPPAFSEHVGSVVARHLIGTSLTSTETWRTIVPKYSNSQRTTNKKSPQDDVLVPLRETHPSEQSCQLAATLRFDATRLKRWRIK